MEDYINENNINEFFGNTVNKLENLLMNHYDYDKKVIGDRVVPIDSSSMSHINGDKFEFDDYIEYDDYVYLKPNAYYIVISTGENAIFTSSYKTYKQDLIIVRTDTMKQYRINSLHVKLFN